MYRRAKLKREAIRTQAEIKRRRPLDHRQEGQPTTARCLWPCGHCSEGGLTGRICNFLPDHALQLQHLIDRNVLAASGRDHPLGTAFSLGQVPDAIGIALRSWSPRGTDHAQRPFYRCLLAKDGLNGASAIHGSSWHWRGGAGQPQGRKPLAMVPGRYCPSGHRTRSRPPGSRRELPVLPPSA